LEANIVIALSEVQKEILANIASKLPPEKRAAFADRNPVSLALARAMMLARSMREVPDLLARPNGFEPLTPRFVVLYCPML
jgi:hypothetical protein